MSAMSSALPMAPNPFNGPLSSRNSRSSSKSKLFVSRNKKFGLRQNKKSVMAPYSLSDHIARIYSAIAT
jgi:hypothetical protein